MLVHAGSAGQTSTKRATHSTRRAWSGTEAQISTHRLQIAERREEAIAIRVSSRKTRPLPSCMHGARRAGTRAWVNMARSAEGERQGWWARVSCCALWWSAVCFDPHKAKTQRAPLVSVNMHDCMNIPAPWASARARPHTTAADTDTHPRIHPPAGNRAHSSVDARLAPGRRQRRRKGAGWATGRGAGATTLIVTRKPPDALRSICSLRGAGRGAHGREVHRIRVSNGRLEVGAQPCTHTLAAARAGQHKRPRIRRGVYHGPHTHGQPRSGQMPGPRPSAAALRPSPRHRDPRTTPSCSIF